MPRIPIPLVGPSSKADSTFQNSGRTVNLQPVTSDASAKAPLSLQHVAGYATAINLTSLFPAGVSLEFRGYHRVGHDRLFFVVNERVYEALDFVAGTVQLWDSLDTFTGYVGMSDNAGWLILGDNSYWSLNLNEGFGVATLQPVLNDGEEQLLGWFPQWVDGVTVYPHRNSGQFSWSEVAQPTVIDGLSYATAEGDPDNINQCLILNRQIFFLGGRSVEVHEYTGNTEGNAIERIPGGFQSYGISCRYSAAECGNFIIFVGRHTDGEGTVVALGNAGQDPVHMSTPAVEKDIAGVLVEQLMEQVTAFYVEDRGRKLYRLNLPATVGSGNRKAQPSKTWQLDIELKLWTELAYTNPATGLFERAKAQHHTLLKGVHYVSAYDSGLILKMDSNLHYDVGGVPLIKHRESAGPLSPFGGARFMVNRVGIEMEVGVGLDGGVQGSDPKLMMAYSWDGGQTFSNEMSRSIGKIGEYKRTVEFGRCGLGRNFVIRVSVSDPVSVYITGAWADVEVGR